MRQLTKLVALVSLWLLTSAACAQPRDMYVTAADGLYIREAPGTSAKVIGGAYFGDRVAVLSEAAEQVTIGGVNGRWTRVRFGGVEGWAFGGYLSDIRPVASPKPNLPPLPISVTMRNSQVGKGYVAQFHNTSGKYLQVVGEFRNPTLSQEKSFVLTVPAWATVEFGWQEGWEFSSGETIRLVHADYSPVFIKIP